MSSDNIKVAIRVRQLIQRELASNSECNWTVRDNSICCNKPDANGKRPVPYIFDRVFDDTAVTEDIFDEICKPIVDSALAGFNGTIFAYGQSSSGKTFTMSGSRVQPGIISLAVDEIFNSIQNIPDREFLIRLGYLEIYNEKVSDLLNPEEGNLKLHEDTDHNIVIAGMREEIVNNLDGVHRVLKNGDARRHTAETKQNDRSSRSHCILRFVIESRLKGHEDDAVNVSNLYFVDLAGSEKANENSGDRFREGCAINRSLFTLGMVIRKLSGDVNQQSSHVSFRDSKLTRILQNALGGNSKTAIICTITPAHVEESDSTLKFASRAKSIKNKAVVNEVMSEAAMLKRYRHQIKKLEDQIEQMKSRSDINLGLEKAELEKRLQEKEAAESQQAEMIAKLQAMIVTAGSSNTTQDIQKKRRRETWCPGKAKRELQAIPELAPSQFSSLREKSLPTKLEEVIEEEDSFQLLENIPVPVVSNYNQHYDGDMTIQTNPAMKELFELQDLYQKSCEELEAKAKEFKELETFTQYEREMEAEQINQLKTDLKKKAEELDALKTNLPWLEEELMKTQGERNSLRQKVDALNAQLGAVADGTGLTKTTAQLKVTETKVTDLNTDLEVQKSQYEFHIQQLKRKLEIYTLMLEEKGVNCEGIKARLAASNIDHCDGKPDSSSQNDEVAQLKEKHEQELNELRSEVDMLVIDRDKGILKIQEMQREFEEEFEKQKSNFQEDISDAQEEVEIYRKLLEAEKAMHKENSGDSSSSQAGTKTEPDIEAVRSDFNSQKVMFELEIDRLKCELDAVKKQETSESIMALDEKSLLNYQKQINELTLMYEQQVAQLTEKLNEQEKIVKTEKDALSKECQTDRVERSVNFDYSSEIENQKEKYESMIQELVEERDAYWAVLEEMRGNNLQVDTFEKLKNGYEEKLLKAKEEVEKYKYLYENHSKQSEDVDSGKPSHDHVSMGDDVRGEPNTNHDEQILELQAEVTKYKDLLEREKRRKRQSIASISFVDESVCINEEHGRLSDVNGEGSIGLDLQKEMIQAEMDELKETKNEIAELKKEIEELKLRLEKTCVSNEKVDGLEISENHLADKFENFNELKLKHESETNDLQAKIRELLLQLDTEKSKNGNVEMNLQNELLLSEREETEKRYIEEIADLKSKLSENEEILEKERAKVERILESVDERRTHSEEQANMKQMYEEKIAELEEDIKIYTKLLEESKEQNKMEINDSNENKLTEIIEAKYSDQIVVLKQELDKFTNLYEIEKEKNDSRESTSVLDENLRLQREELEENHKKEIDYMKQEFAKFAEEHLQNKSNGTESDIEEIKSKYETEILLLNQQITKYEERDEQSPDSYDLRSEMLKAEVDELKEKHKAEIELLNTELEQYRESVKLVDMQNKMPPDEIERLKEKHTEQLEELQAKLRTLEEQTAKHTEKQAEDSLCETDEVKQMRQDLDMLEKCRQCLEEEKERNKQLKTQNSESNKELMMYQSTVEELQDELSNMTAQLQQIQKNIEVLENANARLKQEKLDLLNARDRLSNRSNEQEQTILSLEKTVETLENNIKQLQDDNEVHMAKITELENHIKMGKGMLAKRDEKIRNLKAELEEQTALLDSELNEKVEEMKEYVSELESKVQESEEQQKQASDRILELENSEAQFSDQIITLEADIDMYKAKEEELSKVCTEYEEKIVHLESDLETMKFKITDLEATCTEQEKKIEALMEDLEIAQGKDIELKDVQSKYQEKLADLEVELKQSVNLRADIEAEKKQLQGHCESLTRDIESIKEQLNKELKEKDELLKLKDTAQSQLEEIQQDSKERIKDLEEKLEIYQETLKELKEEIKTNDEQTDLLRSKISELEIERDAAKDVLSENALLKTKIESMELELHQRADSLQNLESEIETVKGKLRAVTESSVDREEIEKLQAKFLQEVSIAEEKVKVMEQDRDQLKLLLQTAIADKELIEKKLEVIEQEKMSLEEDNLQLQRHIDPITLKYHSLPENVDWEQRWEEFVKEEKKKRIVVYSTVRQLKKQVAEAEERQKHAYEKALEDLQRKERSSEVYKELEQQTRKINQEADDLYHCLEDEKKKTADLTQRLAELEAKGTAASKSDTDFMTLDHQCKYKWEGLSAVEKLKSAEIEHAKRITQYEETIQQYDDRIARMKNEIRRLQTNMDNTCIFDGRSGKIPSLNLDSEAKVAAVENPANVSSSSEMRMSYGSSARGGVVDHFKVVVTEAENKRLKQDLERQKKENAKVKEELQNLKMKYSQVEELEKENLSLKNELQKTSGKSNVTTQRDTSLLNSAMSTQPLAEMFVKSDIKAEAMAIPPSPKKETRLEFPNLNPARKPEDKLIKECQREADNCKTS